MPQPNEIERVVVRDADAAAGRAAAWFADVANRAVRARGRFVVALAGGSTPRAAYERLAAIPAERVPWNETHVWFGDERCVPPEDAASNFRMAQEALLAHVPVPPEHVYRIEGERAPADAAARYEALLRGELTGERGFDLVLLGVGTDGHTASLFPGAATLDEATLWAVPAEAPAGVTPHERVTLTFPVLGMAREILVLATGAAKRQAVARALGGGDDVPPSGRVRGRERTVWLLDEAAAGGTTSPS